MKDLLEKLLMLSWYGSIQWTRIFWPVMWLFQFISTKKRASFLQQEASSYNVPVIVVGNITVGGTGKTPVVQSLVAELQKDGLKVGIVSRGYGGQCERYPHLITESDTASVVGDEPLMLFQSLNIPVVVDPDRNQALQRILQCDVDLVISDDGMQHYKLNRQMEICVLDANRGVGNGLLLPVGPLREPVERLDSVDFVLNNLGSGSRDNKQVTPTEFTIEPQSWVNLSTGQQCQLNELPFKPNAKAIAGIGNPQKFFDTLSQINVQCEQVPYADHYDFSEADLKHLQGQVLMTQKDAVKLAPLAKAFKCDDMWYLQVRAQLHNDFIAQFKTQLKHLLDVPHG